MITEEQQKWLGHLDDTDNVCVGPWDRTAEDKYQTVKAQIQVVLSKDCRVEHRGASSLKISGQNEIDVYVPVKSTQFDSAVSVLTRIYENPRSNYHLKRARFATFVQGKHVDVFVVNEDDIDWNDSEIFHKFLLTHPNKLLEYCKLKEALAGSSTKAYYTAKTEFINEVVSEARIVDKH